MEENTGDTHEGRTLSGKFRSIFLADRPREFARTLLPARSPNCLLSVCVCVRVCVCVCVLIVC